MIGSDWTNLPSSERGWKTGIRRGGKHFFCGRRRRRQRFTTLSRFRIGPRFRFFLSSSLSPPPFSRLVLARTFSHEACQRDSESARERASDRRRKEHPQPFDGTHLWPPPSPSLNSLLFSLLPLSNDGPPQVPVPRRPLRLQGRQAVLLLLLLLLIIIIISSRRNRSLAPRARVGGRAPAAAACRAARHRGRRRRGGLGPRRRPLGPRVRPGLRARGRPVPAVERGDAASRDGLLDACDSSQGPARRRGGDAQGLRLGRRGEEGGGQACTGGAAAPSSSSSFFCFAVEQRKAQQQREGPCGCAACQGGCAEEDSCV